MVNNRDLYLDQVFQALSDSTRRAMLRRLSHGGMSVAELAQPFELSKSAITKHLKVLERAGLLHRSIEGRVHRCQLNPEPLNKVANWVQFYEGFWSEKLNALDQFLTSSENQRSQ